MSKVASNPRPDRADPMRRLLEVMARLRHPASGCPWDIEQTFATIAPYTIEEAYEVADAIEEGDMLALKEELGDLLLQVVYHARMAEEAGHFDFEVVAEAITEKMIRRHPHVFGDATVEDAVAQTRHWEELKAGERAQKHKGARRAAKGILADVPSALPALTRAEKLQKRAAGVGFDWPEVAQVFDKIDEEIDELKTEIGNDAPRDRLEAELGDLLFAVANLARHLGVDPEAALRRANAKFVRRFGAVESALGPRLAGATLDEMEEAWQSAKQSE